MKHLNCLRCYGISFSLCCLAVIVSTLQYCPPPDIPADGDYTPKRKEYLSGDAVNYTCNDGFILTGGHTKKCNYDGKWSERTPFCDRERILKNLTGKILHESYLISDLIDGNTNSCLTWEMGYKCELLLKLEKVVVVQAIRIFFEEPVTASISIELENYISETCDFYDGEIETGKWILAQCDSRNALRASEIKIAIKGKTGIICEIQVHEKDESGCEYPPEVTVPNGYFQVSRNSSTLICDDGYNSESGTIVCEGNEWNSPGPKCNENICEPGELNSDLHLHGEWISAGDFGKLSPGTRMRLRCNRGYELIGEPDRVICLDNGIWANTNAKCIERSKGKYDKTQKQNYNMCWAGGAVLVVIIMILLGIIFYLIRKQSNRQAVVVYKATDGSMADGSESIYTIPYYCDSFRPNVPSTPRPAALPEVSDDDYISPEDCKAIETRKPVPDTESGTLKESVIYEK